MLKTFHAYARQTYLGSCACLVVLMYILAFSQRCSSLFIHRLSYIKLYGSLIIYVIGMHKYDLRNNNRLTNSTNMHYKNA